MRCGSSGEGFFLGVYPADERSPQPRGRAFYVQNTHAAHQPGEHWQGGEEEKGERMSVQCNTRTQREREREKERIQLSSQIVFIQSLQLAALYQTKQVTNASTR